MPRRQPILSTLTPALGILVGLLITAPPAPAAAQDAAPRSSLEAKASLPLVRLPEDRQTIHSLVLPNRTLRFTATAGSIPITHSDGTVLADVAFVAYTLEGADRRTRPVAFAFNGGPGAASTWLHLGAIGPWRVPLTASTIAAKASPALVDNAETWLDLADLVFIDPPGTGFSRIWPWSGAGEAPVARPPSSESRRRQGEPPAIGSGPAWFWSLRGDIVTFATVIQSWAGRADRLASPIVLVGESYGGFRAPLIAETLGRNHALTVRAMVLVSPVLDFEGRRGGHLRQFYVGLLPSLAATKLERGGATLARVGLADVEIYARGDYLLDLVRGARDVAALDRMSAKVAMFSGLGVEYVRSHHGRISARTFLRDGDTTQPNTISLYDAGMAGLEATPSGSRGGFADPFTAGLSAPLTAAMRTLHARLDWKVERPYVMLSSETNRAWTWRNSPHPPESLSTLQALTQNDQRLRTLVVHGFTDLVTPYFATALQLDQLPSHGPEQRIRLEVYPGGHMLYSRDGSRAQFRADAERLIREVLQPTVR